MKALCIFSRVSFLFASGFFALAFLAPMPAYALVKCAVLAAETNVNDTNDVQSKLMGTGEFSSVTIINVHSTTPTLAQLQAYESILVFSDNSFSDPTTLGDNLADYVDGGGGVVVAVFAIGDLPLGGRFSSDDYYAIEPGAGTSVFTAATLGTVLQAGSPALAGVATFDGGTTASRISSATVNSHATLIAEWSDGLPLVATRVINGANRVDLNFFPPSSDAGTHSWLSTTNGAQLLANAVVIASTPATELPSGAIPTVTISGKKKALTTKTVYIIKGTASANATSVLLTVGKGKKVKVKAAKGTTAWTFKVHLMPGVNKISAQARSATGILSAPAKIKVIHTS